MSKKEQAILHQLVNARESIRRKYNILKRNKESIQKAVGETFKPLVDPLDKLVTLSEKTFKKFPQNVIKPNERENDITVESDDIETDAMKYDSVGEASDATLQASKTFTEADPIISEYTQMVKSGSDNLDKLYGVYENRDKLQLGNSEISFDKGNILVKNQSYPTSRGLLELLFKRKPNMNVVNQDDESYYRQILNLTSAHKRNHKEDGELRRHKSTKFNSIISPMFGGRGFPTLFESKFGKGFQPRYKVAKFNTYKDYVYWDDPNELVDRLRLLMAEKSAGNNAHINEISSIIEELREGGYIY